MNHMASNFVSEAQQRETDELTRMDPLLFSESAPDEETVDRLRTDRMFTIIFGNAGAALKELANKQQHLSEIPLTEVLKVIDESVDYSVGYLTRCCGEVEGVDAEELNRHMRENAAEIKAKFKQRVTDFAEESRRRPERGLG